jgi:uncharacterized protein (DUF983 family)
MTTTHQPTKWTTALRRGWRRMCPRCGCGQMFRGYLTIGEECANCALPFEPLRADDAPAYFTIAIVGHVIVSGLLMLEAYAHPPTWVQLLLWLPMTAALSLSLLPFLKGAVMAAIYCSQQDE